jgi:chorismate mutase
MHQLRQKVDQTDREILKLLQKRTKIANAIGKEKRLRHATVYVPERERELLRRLVQQSKGKVPPQVVRAVYREIFSGSRAAQGQKPVGLLKTHVERTGPDAQFSFGASNKFAIKKTLHELLSCISKRSLSLASVPDTELLRELNKARWRKDFLQKLTIGGELARALGADSKKQRDLIVMPREAEEAKTVNRFVILIECKSTQTKLKELLQAVPKSPLEIEHIMPYSMPKQKEHRMTLVYLRAKRNLSAAATSHKLTTAANSKGLSLSILGTYLATKAYGR